MLALLGIMFLGLSAAVAWSAEAKGVPQTKTGTVKKVDAAAKQIVVMVARELTFTITDDTKIVEGDDAKKLSDIKVDGKVSVTYVKEGETRTASRIVIEKDKK